jgi:hypothetical protein
MPFGLLGLGIQNKSVLDRAVALWRADHYDAATDALLDQSGNGNHLTLGSAVGADTNDPRVLVPHNGKQYLHLPGIVGNHASTPDAAPLDIIGDIEIRARVSLDDWTSGSEQNVVAKWNTTGAQRAYHLYINGTGAVVLQWSTTGADFPAESVNDPGFVDGQTYWLRVTLDVDNGAADAAATFYWSSDETNDPDAVTWAQISTPQLVGATTSIFASTAEMRVGIRADDTLPMAGNIYRTQVLDGIGGTVEFDADFTTQPTEPFATFTEGSSNAATVTINRAATGRKATMVDRPMLLFGTDDYAEVTGRRNVATNPSAEVDTTGWVVVGSPTLATQTTFTQFGGRGFRLTSSALTEQQYANLVLANVTAQGQSVTISAYFKYNNHQWIYLGDGAHSSWNRVWFDVQNGIVGTQTNATGTVEDVGGGVYRCSVTYTVGAGTPTTVGVAMGLADADGNATMTGTAAEIVDFDAVLAEPGATAANSYLDGDSPYGAWVGTVHDSASIETGVPQNISLNPSFEVDATTDWQLGEGSADQVRITSDSHIGSASAKITATGGNVRHTRRISTGVAAAAGTTWTVSVFAKASVDDWFVLQERGDSATHQGFFDLTNGVVGSTFLATSAIESVGNGWYRCSITFTLTNAISVKPAMGPCAEDNTPTYTPAGTPEEVLIDGLFINPGDTAFDYGDGNSDGWEWDGTADLSTSREVSDLNVGLLQDFTLLVATRSYDVTPAGNNVLAAKKNALGNQVGYALYSIVTAPVSAHVADGAQSDADDTGNMTDGQAHVVGMVRNLTDDDIEAFLDGNGSGSPTTDQNTATLASEETFTVGATSAGASVLEGEAFAIAFFREALSDEDVLDASRELAGMFS